VNRALRFTLLGLAVVVVPSLTALGSSHSATLTDRQLAQRLTLRQSDFRSFNWVPQAQPTGAGPCWPRFGTTAQSESPAFVQRYAERVAASWTGVFPTKAAAAVAQRRLLGAVYHKCFADDVVKSSKGGRLVRSGRMTFHPPCTPRCPFVSGAWSARFRYLDHNGNESAFDLTHVVARLGRAVVFVWFDETAGDSPVNVDEQLVTRVMRRGVD
jgi:hypothetical protein